MKFVLRHNLHNAALQCTEYFLEPDLKTYLGQYSVSARTQIGSPIKESNMSITDPTFQNAALRNNAHTVGSVINTNVLLTGEYIFLS